MARASVPEEERNMELELIGHQGAKDRSTHSFHVSGIYTSITQGSQELRESPGLAARRIDHQATENEVIDPTCSSSPWLQF